MRSTARYAGMSDGDGSVGAGGGTSLRGLERRLALTMSEGRLSLQDQLDWAEALLGEGAMGEGRLLLQSAAIQCGFSSQMVVILSRLDPTSVLHVASPPAPSRRGNTVELAMSELRVLAQAVGPLIAGRVARGAARTTFSAGLHPVVVLARPALRPSKRPIDALVAELSAWLQVPDRGGDDLAGVLVDSLIGASGLAGPAVCGFAAAPRSLLAEVIALTSLRRFLLDSSDLLYTPLGSTRLFHVASRLDGAGLGPYFSNIGQIVRRSADMFELAGLAVEASSQGANQHLEEAWVALMSRGLTDERLDEVIDDLGDRNGCFALEIILKRLLQAPVGELDTRRLARIRDAALDNLNYALASYAQRALVDFAPTDQLERAILGVIDASGGRYRAAEDTFVACLAKTPEDQSLVAQLDAARSRRFERFAVTKGFGSPGDRQLYRLRRRSQRLAQSGAVAP